jgi:hypothetical protein
MNEICCEPPECSLLGTICPTCKQCYCWQHRRRSSCETCQKLLSQGSFEHRSLHPALRNSLPPPPPRQLRDYHSATILFLVVGSLLIWISFLARACRSINSLSPKRVPESGPANHYTVMTNRDLLIFWALLCANSIIESIG